MALSPCPISINPLVACFSKHKYSLYASFRQELLQFHNHSIHSNFVMKINFLPMSHSCQEAFQQEKQSFYSNFVNYFFDTRLNNVNNQNLLQKDTLVLILKINN